jgi:hypothetical protein
VLAFVSRDSFLMRFLEKFNLTQVYEHAAVNYNNGKYCGRNNTEIPNFVYRWTEREIEKIIQTYAPYYKHRIKYRYGTAFPSTLELESQRQSKTLFSKVYKTFSLASVKGL